jgi:MFS family permease
MAAELGRPQDAAAAVDRAPSYDDGADSGDDARSYNRAGSSDGTPARAAVDSYDVARVQRRTVLLLSNTQIIGGVGVSVGMSVGTLLAADLAGVWTAGLAQSVSVVGSALLAVPTVRIMRQYGRRPGLVAAYLTAAVGGIGVVVAAMADLVPLLFVALFLFGGGTTAGMQARYTAVDLALPERRGRQLSLVVWATTVGAVAGPNLAPLAGTMLAGYDVPTLAGPFVFSAVLFALAAVTVLVLLRPDPLLTARRISGRGSAPGQGAPARVGMGAALAAVVARPAARLGVAAMAVGHLVMIGVMAMTPVHILDAGHSEAHTLRIVGIVLSLHIAGMFAFAPVTGWLTDRWGRRPVILTGVVLLLASCAVAGTAGHDPGRLSVGLFLLGLGWSATMVAGSTLLSESVPGPVRPSAQGLADMLMGLAGAAAGALSGLVLAWSGFPALTMLAALATVPLAALALRPVHGKVYE